jgi:tetraacyldisaccharide 4'-kinase
MVEPPGFWCEPSGLGKLLKPLGGLTRIATERRLKKRGWIAPVPVLCCGNVTVGGAGKTTLALDLGRRLLERGINIHFLTRGYGGQTKGPVRVDPARHGADLTGDEPLLLAGLAPTWVAVDRAAGAREAVAAGAQMLIMDDGLQNPGLIKTLSLLLVDGASGFGNGYLLPAGPLREPIETAAARCAAAILIGPDLTDAVALLPNSIRVLRASLRQDQDLTDRRVMAFAGIARPSKFWTTLEEAGAVLVGRHPFPDHHPYRPDELDRLVAEANRLDAMLVTTPKDAMRLPPSIRAHVSSVGVTMVWEDPAAIDQLLDQLVAQVRLAPVQ